MPPPARVKTPARAWELYVGRAVLGYRQPVPRHLGRRYLICRLRIREVIGLIVLRHGGPCNTDDALIYAEFAVGHIATIARDPEAYALRWAQDWTPGLTPHQVKRLVWEALELPRRFDADEAGWHLRVKPDDRRALGLTTIGTMTEDAAARAERRRLADVERLRKKRLAAGATPHVQSAAAEARTQGVHRSTILRRRRRAEAAECNNSSAPMRRNNSSAPGTLRVPKADDAMLHRQCSRPASAARLEDNSPVASMQDGAADQPLPAPPPAGPDGRRRQDGTR